jgi:hypothetical protein
MSLEEMEMGTGGRKGERERADSHLLELLALVHHVVEVDDEGDGTVFLEGRVSPVHLF